MATVFRRKLTRWILDGKRVDKGTPGAKRHTTKSREWYGLVRGEYVKLSPLRDIAEQKLRQKLREIEESRVNQFAVHRRSALADHIAKFREHLEATCRSARYVRETIQRLNVVAAKCTLLEHITSDHVDTCLNDLAKLRHGDRGKKNNDETSVKGAAAATRNNYLAAVKSFCSWCVKTRRMSYHPLVYVSKLNEEADVRAARRTLSAEEFDHLIATTIKSDEWIRGISGPDRAMLYLLAVGTGFRASELGSLTTASLRLEDDPPLVVVDAAYSKRRRRDEQPLPVWLAERLRGWLANRTSLRALSPTPQLLWPGSWKRHAAKMLRADLQAAGIEYCDANGRVFDFHSLRHQYISNLADAGIHPRTAQELARHSSIDLTMKRYTHLAPRTIIGAVESIPEPGTTFGAPNVGNRGDARVTAEGAKQGQKWPKASETQKDNLRPRKMKKTPANTGVS